MVPQRVAHDRAQERDRGNQPAELQPLIAQFNALNHRQIQLEQRSAVHTGNGRLNRAMITIR